jgi:hypothetical protein
MNDWVSQLRDGAKCLRVGDHTIEVDAVGLFGPGRDLGVSLSGYTPNSPEGPRDYLSDLLLVPEHRESTYRIVDSFGLLICHDVQSQHPGYRDVRGRSSRGRLSQGEYYHHDGCIGPRKPRVVEIRFPHQEVERHVATAVAPYPASVYAMLRHANEILELDPTILEWLQRLEDEGELPPENYDLVQGLVTRTIRRELDAEAARAFFREVDERCEAYREPCRMGESRLISNAHPETGQVGTMQHRRADLHEHRGGVANGKLVKRWPAEELER